MKQKLHRERERERERLVKRKNEKQKLHRERERERERAWVKFWDLGFFVCVYF